MLVPLPASTRLSRFLLAVALTGCGAFGTPQIRRTVGGESRVGNYVSPYSYEHFVRGELAAERGDLREAYDEYRQARTGPADDPLLIARLADVLDQLGHEVEALELLAQGDELSPDDESIHMERGRIHERHDRLDDAADAYGRAASAAPSSEQGPLALAALLRRRDEPTEADAVLERYLGRARGAGAARARLALAIERRDPLAAAEAVRALLEAAPARASEVRAAAVTALDGGQPELALRLLAALAEDPADRPLRLRAAIEARQRELAEGMLAEWMPAEPNDLIQVADGYLAIGMPERALELGRVAMGEDGGPLARLVVARALIATGHPDEAAPMLAALEPGSRAWPGAPLALAEAMRAMGRPALAAETLARAAERAPDPALSVALADARLDTGAGEAALAALAGEAALVRAARARVLDRLGRHADAVTAYLEVPVDDPTVPLADRARAQAERALADGQRERAVSLLREQAEAAPEDAAARRRLDELLSAS
ncbi:MAG: tetratricopeptide repeat protein [Sandaracinaceae bacterium]